MIKDDKEWLYELNRDFKGNIASTINNIVLILKNDEKLKNIVYNTMTNNIQITGELPWDKSNNNRCWSSADNACLLLYLEKNYGIYAPYKYKDAMQAYYETQRKWHPVREYISKIKWDGINRIDTLLIDYLGADDTEYVRQAMRKTLIAAVSRVFNPGIKFDSVLVLCGPQGIGKSTFFSKIGGEWYSDSLSVSDMRDKTGAEKLQGIWIMELAELAGLRKVDVDVVKAFLSRTDDKYRHTYGLSVESHPRSCIIVGTTNTYDGFLRDITGNRRFWPVNVNGNGKKTVWKMLPYEIEQIWAEAYQAFVSEECLFFETELEQEAYSYQTQALESDPKQGIIEEYLNNLDVDRICLMEIWCECLMRERQDMKKGDAYELEGILKKIGGWKVYDSNTTGKTRIPGYGVQKTFVRV